MNISLRGYNSTHTMAKIKIKIITNANKVVKELGLSYIGDQFGSFYKTKCASAI